MSQRARFIYEIVSIGIALLCLLSCAPKPELEWVPQIKSVSAKVSDNTCVLAAEISADLTDGCACGFFYGKTQDNMRRLQVSPDGKKFNLTLESLDYETEYFYKAFVSNGRNEISSDLRHFRTLKEKEVPRTMTLPFNTIEVEPEETEFVLEVGGDADFSVNISDTVSWIFYRRDDRVCRFHLKANTEANERTCNIVFINLSDNQSDTLSVIQAAKAEHDNLPKYRKEVSFCSSTFGATLPEKLLGDIKYVSDDSQQADWIRWVRSDESGYTRLDFYIDENQGDDERTCNLIISYDGLDNFLTIMQESVHSFIKFDEPLVKQACVDAFDLNVDGELSYYEASVPDNIDCLDFFQMDIKSFDEFQWFTSVKEIHSAVFQLSEIESIKFPASLTTLHDGVFAGCKKLADIDLEDIVVISSFPECESLESVKTKIAGDFSFSHCTNLKTVVQQLSGVPSRAFLHCENLVSFTFEITEPGVHYVGRSAFEGCVLLPAITIPEDITEIRDNAFKSCISLTSVYMEPLQPPLLGEHVFAGTSDALNIYVPAESLARYEQAWPSLAHLIVPDGQQGGMLPQDLDYIDEYGINHGPGIKIGETVWAPVNCGYHELDYEWGKLYQWGRKYGQGYDGDLYDKDWNKTYYSDAIAPEQEDGPVNLVIGQSGENADKFYCNSEDSENWCTHQYDDLWNSGTMQNPVKTGYDPCPEGWRVPSYEELYELIANHSSWITDENGQSGFWFSGPSVYDETVPRVFFPAAGFRFCSGYACNRGYSGSYRTSRPTDYCNFLSFTSIDIGVDVGTSRASGCSVRCVRE